VYITLGSRRVFFDGARANSTFLGRVTLYRES